MEKKYKFLKEEYEKLKQEFNLQLQELNKTKDIQKFHDFLTEIIAKYPDQKDLIKFITFINDELSRNYQLYDEVIIDTINEMLEKQKLLSENLFEHSSEIKNILQSKADNKTTKTSKIKSFFKNLSVKDLKFIIGGVILILILIILLIDPTLIDKLFGHIFHFFKFLSTGKV